MNKTIAKGNYQFPDFYLGDKLTAEHVQFFNEYGFIRFKNFVSKETVDSFIKEAQAIEQKWLKEGIDKINGVPLKFGEDEKGKRMISRFAFLSQHSELLHDFLQDSRLASLTKLLYPYEGRIAEDEKDGLVLNHYLQTPNSGFTKMGWHTDSPRDLFYGHKIMPMLNVGLHLDNCPYTNGGLRVLPGTHRQGVLRLLFGKKYFIDNKPDPKEVGFDIEAGDLTVHHGSIWHRVQQSNKFGSESRRRVMYIPLVTGKYKPKNAESKTPLYHHVLRRRFLKKFA
ncbi:MAG: phytanoyl-CoA dioxygenase family protein [Bacteroidota bacterium]|nr:phytanoyl-CoA dioxygenase family protein [Bacteroidota bacterium]